jgi:hypothetical protein
VVECLNRGLFLDSVPGKGGAGLSALDPERDDALLFQEHHESGAVLLCFIGLVLGMVAGLLLGWVTGLVACLLYMALL